MQRPRFDLNYIKRELEKIGAALPRRIEFYLLGGGALAFHGLKESTKDIDLISTSLKDAESLVETLKSLDYQTMKSLPDEYRKMGASAVLKNPEGFQLDVFHHRVCNALVLSQRMVSRSKRILKHEMLTVYLIAKEDIFLFKGITERELDLDDMRAIAESRMDWGTVFRECIVQSASSEPVWEAFLYDRLVDLEEKYGISAPVSSRLRKIAEEKMTQRALIEKIGGGKNTLKEIAEEIKFSESWVRIELNKLDKKGLLTIDKSKRPYHYQLATEDP